MNSETLLLRQVHPDFVQGGTVSELAFTSQVFTPTKKDKEELSTYNGEKFSPEKSHSHFTEEMEFESIGVVAVSCGECDSEHIPYDEDNDPFDGHCFIDFKDAKENNQKRKRAKKLKRFARERGWLYKE